MSASGALIPRAGEAFTKDCSIVVKDSKVKSKRIIPVTTEVFGLEESIDLILGMDWLRANTTRLSWDITDELMFRPDVGLGLSGMNTEKQVAQDASEANAERLVAKDDMKAERLVADDAKAERLIADRVNIERLVAHPGEKLNIDILVVSSLSE